MSKSAQRNIRLHERLTAIICGALSGEKLGELDYLKAHICGRYNGYIIDRVGRVRLDTSDGRALFEIDLSIRAGTRSYRGTWKLEFTDLGPVIIGIPADHPLSARVLRQVNRDLRDNLNKLML